MSEGSKSFVWLFVKYIHAIRMHWNLQKKNKFLDIFKISDVHRTIIVSSIAVYLPFISCIRAGKKKKQLNSFTLNQDTVKSDLCLGVMLSLNSGLYYLKY